MAAEQKLENMNSVVDHLRAHVSLIFQAVVHSSSDSQEEQRRKIQGYIETVGQGLKKLQERGKEVQAELALGGTPAPPVLALLEARPELHEALHEEQVWQRKVSARAMHSLRTFEGELFSRFPAKRFHSSVTSVRMPDASQKAKKRKTTFSSPSQSVSQLQSTPSPACVGIPRTATPGSELLDGPISCSTKLHISDSLETMSQLERILREVATSTGLHLSAPEPRSDSAPRTIEVECVGVFRASCLLAEENVSEHHVVVQRIAIVGHGEESGPWKRSRFGVFRRVTEQAEKALIHFRSNYRSSAMRRLLLWLMYYKNLFTAPCRHCRRHLYNDSEEYRLLPPTVRSYDDGVPSHPQCVPQ